MFDLFQKLVYSIMDLQEKILKKNNANNMKTSFSHSTSKRFFGSAASLQLTTKTEQNKRKLENNIKVILAKYSNSPQKLLGFVRRSGTNVYKIAFANKILKLIGCEEGFISETKGIKGLSLNILTSLISKEKLNLSLKSEPMFILNTVEPDCHFIVQQFHKWYAMKLNLPGFDSKSQDNFQKFLEPGNDHKIKDLSIEEIIGLKEAIARDVEAINFVVELAKTTTGAKNALKKITVGGASV